ncbi:ABC transporter substrate-binding protein [Microbacterium esteraromaticum]|uniref:ABC transporter substrate-binding protein n=1 Tax=Microbacterium esteraromaticum TaxID=57043 RepID=UPI001CD64E92|nr:ABC transporter substrate-binding protein [Microbacterium esteraromaticum]MCA1307862.1 ABC transporter substrate-binding protein [Microbacterium esteraromaticum]
MDSEEAPDIDALTRTLDVHSLRILVAIDQEGSISAAARSLGFTQPTITQHVQRLEARLGATLIARTARSAALTPVGAILAQHAPRIDASLTAAATELARALGRRAGTVRLTGPVESIGPVIAPTAARLAADSPGVEVSVTEAADTVDALDRVRSGRADIAVTVDVAASSSRRQAAPRRQGARSTFLFAEEIVAVTVADADAPGGRIDPLVLAELPWIGGRGTSSDVIAQAIGRTPARGDITTSRPDAALALAANGLGVAFLAESDLAGIALEPGARALGLSPAFTRRTWATTLVEASGIPPVAAAVRTLAVHRPTFADVEASLDARRRSESHRARFRTTAPLPEEIPAMPFPLTNRLAKAATVAATGALLLTACSTPAPQQTTGADTGAEIDHITVALPGSLSSLYVGQEAGILNYYIASIAQEGLVSIDAQGRVQPGLAESWEQTDDVTYVYTLRDDAVFQDGSPVTADDVVFSLERARDETSSPGLAYYLMNVDTIAKTGDNEVTITLTEPDAAFASNMSTGGAAFITSKAFWEEHDGKVGTADSLLLGSGPYEVTEFSPDSHVTFERVDSWWGELPKVKEITVNFVSDESTRLLAAQSGDVDVAFNVPLAQSQQWEKLDTMRVEYVNDLSYVGLYFNIGVAPFDDPKVREAFAHAVDRDAYVEKLLRGHGEAATAIMTPESLGQVHDADDARDALAGIPQWEFDLDAAKAALAASSVPEGFETELLTPNTGPQLGTAAQALAQNLAEIGVTVNVREVPIEEWLASLDASSDHGVNLMWYFSTLGDPAEVPSYLLGAGNPAGYDNPAIVDLLAQAGAESDPAARADLLIEAEALQAADAINVPLWWGQSATAFANDLGMNDYSAFAFISSWPTQLYRAGQ